MRMLVLALVVLGCRGSSPGSGAPSGSGASPGPAVSADVAAIAAFADQACACKDAPCRDQVHDRWKATPPAPHAAGDPSRMSPHEVAAEVDHDMAYHTAQMRLYGCLEPDHGAPVVTARVQAFAARACACPRSDAPCLDQVKIDFDRYLEVAWLLQEGYSPADRQALQDQMRKFEICHQVGPT